MGFRVFPTENNIGIAFGFEAQQIREGIHANLIVRRGRAQLDSFACDVFALNAAGGLAVSVGTGNAIINGFLVEIVGSAETRSGLTASSTNFIYLKYTLDTGLVVSASLDSNTTGTAPGNSVLVGLANTDGSQVTGVTTIVAAPYGPFAGNYTGDGAGSVRTIFLGWRPKLVIIQARQSTASGEASWYISPMLVGTQTNFCGVKLEGLLTGVFTGRLSQDDNKRPLIVNHGFTIGGASSDMNINTQVYDYLAWA